MELINNKGNQPPARKQSKRIPGTDGIRGIGILMVLATHASYSLPKFLQLAALPAVANGRVAMQTFFVMSGYLIYELSAKEFEKTGKFDWRQFYLRRVLRIFPCFYSYIAVVAILTGLGLLILAPAMIFAVLTFTWDYRDFWFPASIPSNEYVIEHYWTLCTEEQFYLSFPFLMYLFARKRLLPVVIGMIALAPFVRVFCYFFFPESRSQIGFNFHTNFDAIAMGILLGEMWRRPRLKAWLQALAGNGWALGGSLVFLLVLTPVLVDHLKGSYSIAIGRSLELIATGILVITAAKGSSSSVLSAVLNWPPIVYIGALSYSLYVWNPLFLNPESNWVVNRFPLNFICAFGAAIFSYYIIEKPILGIKDRLRHRQEARATETARLDQQTQGLPVTGDL
jgi:peptidoglycan/LPS O-acetylase OafA/YrhL